MTDTQKAALLDRLVKHFYENDGLCWSYIEGTRLGEIDSNLERELLTLYSPLLDNADHHKS
jgi:hypothetical protein